MKKTIATIVAGMAALTVAAAHTAAVDVKEIVKKTKAAYESTSSAEVKFEQNGDAGSISGTLLYGKGNKYRLELANQTTVSDGERTWLYFPAKNQVVITRASNAKGRLTPNEILTAFPGNYDVKLLGEKTVNGRGVWVVGCTPGSGDRIGDITSATLYIDKTSYRFQQIDVQSPTIGSMQIRIVDARYGARVPDTRFTLTPPAGARVVDLSK